MIADWNRADLDPYTFNDYVPHLIALWSDDGIQACFNARGSFQLGESIRYFMQNIDRIKDSAYEPTKVRKGVVCSEQ